MIRLAVVVSMALSAGVAQAQIAANPEKAARFNTLIESAEAAIGHWAYDTQLDVMRAKLAAGFELSKLERARMGRMALDRGCSIEAETVLAPLAATGEFGGPLDPNRQVNAALFEAAQRDAQAHRTGDLLRREQLAPALATGQLFLMTGEAYFAIGDYEKALALIQKGIAKGGLPKDDIPFVQLQLGIAQYRTGRVLEARTTWRAISSDRGARELAQAWLVIASD